MLSSQTGCITKVFKMAWTAAKSSGKGLFQLCRKSNTHAFPPVGSSVACLPMQGADGGRVLCVTNFRRPGISIVIGMMPCPRVQVPAWMSAVQGGEGGRRTRRPWLGLLRLNDRRVPIETPPRTPARASARAAEKRTGVVGKRRRRPVPRGMPAGGGPGG